MCRPARSLRVRSAVPALRGVRPEPSPRGRRPSRRADEARCESSRSRALPRCTARSGPLPGAASVPREPCAGSRPAAEQALARTRGHTRRLGHRRSRTRAGAARRPRRAVPASWPCGRSPRGPTARSSQAHRAVAGSTARARRRRDPPLPAYRRRGGLLGGRRRRRPPRTHGAGTSRRSRSARSGLDGRRHVGAADERERGGNEDWLRGRIQRKCFCADDA